MTLTDPMHAGTTEPSAATYSPRDSLKEVVALVTDLIDHAIDELSSREVYVDESLVGEILDSAKREMVLALARHVPGVSWNSELGIAAYTAQGRREAGTFDDASVVSKLVPLTDDGREGLIATWWPRRDGPLEDFKRRMLDSHRRRSLRLVDGVDTRLVALPHDDGEDG